MGKCIGVFAGSVAGALLLSHPAVSQDRSAFGVDFLPPDFVSDVEEIFETVTEGLQVRLGAGTVVAPSYEGDNSYEARFFPKLSIRWRDRVFLTNTRLEVVAWKGEQFVVGPLIQYRFGRSEKHDADLTGLGNVPDAFELGGFVQWRTDWFIMGADLVGDVASGHNGLIGTVWIGSQMPLTERISLSAGTRVTWASGAYMRANFGITPRQSAASGLPVFRASGGIKDVGARVKVRYRLLESWRINSSIAYVRLLGDAADSPLVRERGSPNQFIWSLSAQYSF